MNKRQLKSMWVGIILFVLMAITWIAEIEQRRLPSDIAAFVVATLIILAPTCDLIYTFRDKKTKDRARTINQ